MWRVLRIVKSTSVRFFTCRRERFKRLALKTRHSCEGKYFRVRSAVSRIAVSSLALIGFSVHCRYGWCGVSQGGLRSRALPLAATSWRLRGGFGADARVVRQRVCTLQRPRRKARWCVPFRRELTGLFETAVFLRGLYLRLAGGLLSQSSVIASAGRNRYSSTFRRSAGVQDLRSLAVPSVFGKAAKIMLGFVARRCEDPRFAGRVEIDRPHDCDFAAAQSR